MPLVNLRAISFSYTDAGVVGKLVSDPKEIELNDFNQTPIDPNLFEFKNDPTIKIRYDQLNDEYFYADDSSAKAAYTYPSTPNIFGLNFIPDAIIAPPPLPGPPGEPPLSAAQEQELVEKFDKYEQQCMIMRELRAFLPQAPSVFSNFIMFDSSVPEEIFKANNLIHGTRFFKDFVNIPNHVIAALVPKIKLYKSYMPERKKDGGPKSRIPRVVDVELPLEEYISQDDILKDNISKGFGYGLESFSWENTSFNEVDRNISANLVLKFSNMDSFTKPRKGFITDVRDLDESTKEELKKFRFLELIYQAPGKVNTPNEEAQKFLRFKIKVAVGWEFSDAVLDKLDVSEHGINMSKLKTAIKANNYILYLYNKGHDINIDSQGRVTVTINYQSAAEAKMTDEIHANILGPEESLSTIETDIQDIELARQAVTTAKQQAEPEVEIERLEQIVQSLEEKKEVDVTKSTMKIYSDFLDGMFTRGIVKFFKVTAKDISNLKKEVYPTTPGASLPIINIDFASVRNLSTIFASPGNAGLTAASSINNLAGVAGTPAASSNPTPSKILEDLKNQLVQKNTNSVIVPYVFFGDILDYVLEKVNKNNEDPFDPLRVLVGPIVYERLESSTVKGLQQIGALPKGRKVIDINTNLANIPISFEFFLSWFDQTIVQTKRRTFNFKHFLSAMLDRLLKGALTPTCFGRNLVSATPKVDVFLFNTTRKNGKDLLTGRAETDKTLNGTVRLGQIEQIDQAYSFGNPMATNLVQYLYIQMFHADSRPVYEINEVVNEQQGVYHLKAGIDRGIIKQVNFAKDELTAMPVAIYSQQGTINPKVLRTPYNATVSMLGNTVFKPGNIVYVDPTFTLSIPTEKLNVVSAIEEMGLGGYYIITAARNQISSGKFTTELSLRFTNYGLRKKQPVAGT